MYIPSDSFEIFQLFRGREIKGSLSVLPPEKPVTPRNNKSTYLLFCSLNSPSLYASIIPETKIKPPSLPSTIFLDTQEESCGLHPRRQFPKKKEKKREHHIEPYRPRLSIPPYSPFLLQPPNPQRVRGSRKSETKRPFGCRIDDRGDDTPYELIPRSRAPGFRDAQRTSRGDEAGGGNDGTFWIHERMETTREYKVREREKERFIDI